MMTFRKLLLALILTFPLISHAQTVPGYLGKRFAISYNAYISPSFLNPNKAEIEFSGNQPDVGFSINYQHHLTGEFVLSKKWSLIGDVHYTNTYVDPSGDYGFDFFGLGESYILDEFPGVQAFGFCLGGRSYNKHFAPLGSYIEYRAGYASVSVDDFNYTSATSGQNMSIDGGNTGSYLLGLAWGVNRVYRDQFLISLSFELSYFGEGWSESKRILGGDATPLSLSEGNSQSNQDQLIEKGAGRYAMETFINFRIGVGYLP